MWNGVLNDTTAWLYVTCINQYNITNITMYNGMFNKSVANNRSVHDWYISWNENWNKK